MKNIIYLILFTCCVSLVWISCHPTKNTMVESELSSMDSSKIVAEIQTIMNQQTKCWNNGDLSCFTSYYADKSYSCIVGNQGLICGQDSIALIYEKAYPPERMGKLQFSNLDIRPLTPKYVLLRGKYTLDHEENFFQSGWYTLVLKKFEEGWKIISDQTG